MCIVTVLSHGLRSGGGVGDVLRKPSKEVAASPGDRGAGAGAGAQTGATQAAWERARMAGQGRLLGTPSLSIGHADAVRGAGPVTHE